MLQDAGGGKWDSVVGKCDLFVRRSLRACTRALSDVLLAKAHNALRPCGRSRQACSASNVFYVNVCCGCAATALSEASGKNVRCSDPLGVFLSHARCRDIKAAVGGCRGSLVAMEEVAPRCHADGCTGVHLPLHEP